MTYSSKLKPQRFNSPIDKIMPIKNVPRGPHEHVNPLPVKRALVAGFRISIYDGQHLKRIRLFLGKLQNVLLTLQFTINSQEWHLMSPVSM